MITCNPPYFKVNETSLINGNKKLSIARHEIELVLEDIFVLSSQYLKDNGVLYMVHRSERIDEMFILANKYGMNIKNMQLIATNDDMKPYLVLIKYGILSKRFPFDNKSLGGYGLSTINF